MKPLLLLPALAGLTFFTPPGSVRKPGPIVQDSIYKLAVNPADYAGDAVVFLLDEAVHRVETNGRTSNTVRQVVQILKQEGAEAYRERRLSWNPEHQKLTVNWMRVVKPSGEVIAEKPEQVQDSDVPAAMGTPMYAASKVRRMSLSGLEPGTILDFSITTDSDAPMMPGEFFISWRVNPPIPVVRSNLVVDMPASLKPKIKEYNLDFRRQESAEKGRTIYTWATSKVAKIKGESFAPDTIIQAMTVTVSPPFSWASIGEWYAPIAKEAYTITPSVEEKMAKVLSGARSLDDSIGALHKWVAQDIRYVAIELGRGGYVPRNAETVVRTGFGDCKDKAMLFLAALKKIGVTGYPVLLNASGAERKETPSLGQFNHMIAAVKRGNGYQFADLTAGTYPLGKLPLQEQGNLAVLVKEKSAEQITLPETPASENRIDTRITGKLGEDGNFSGTHEEWRTGDLEQTVRMLFQTPPDSLRRQMIGRTITGLYFDRPETDSLQGFDGKDFDAKPMMRTKIVRARMVSRTGDVSLLVNPVRPLESYSRLADALEKEKDRKLPYETSRLVSAYTTHIEVTIDMPPGWTATLPKNEKLDGPVARYEVTYSQKGTQLRIQRTLAGSRGTLPASRQKEIVEWLRKVGDDQSKLIVIKAPPHSIADKQ